MVNCLILKLKVVLKYQRLSDAKISNKFPYYFGLSFTNRVKKISHNSSPKFVISSVTIKGQVIVS